MKRTLSIYMLLFCALLLCSCGKGEQSMSDLSSPSDGITVKKATEAAAENNTPTTVEEVLPTKAADNEPLITPLVTEAAPTEPISDTLDITIRLAGDINLDEDWSTTQYMDSCENGIYDCFDEEMLSLMQTADIMYLNNEFTYGTDTEKLPNKMYNFRALPERAKVLTQLGVDVVSLANNHTFDYGEKGITETLKALDAEGIPHFGAGNDLEEAMQPVIIEIQGIKIAFLTAMSDDCDTVTLAATSDTPGIVRAWSGSAFTEKIREVREEADYVIVAVHWGYEYTYDLLDSQLELAKEFTEAGADIIVGAHPHIIQGIDFVNGKPVFYSLGNYWFNEKDLYTMLAEVHIGGDRTSPDIAVRLIPAKQKDFRTTAITDEETLADYRNVMVWISRNGSAELDENWYLYEK